MSDMITQIENTDFSKIVEVVFTKVDGSSRTMRCTTNDKYIREDMKPKGGVVNYSDQVKRVFDIDIDEWRSFRTDSVISIRELGE